MVFMSINDLLEKIKPYYTLILIVVLISILFAILRISVMESQSTPIKIEYASTANVITTVSPTPGIGGEVTNNNGQVIGSKSGKKYYYPWCGTVKRIKPENQVPFASIEVARSAGYTPAGNCKGLK